jgi:Tfp pilus assembly protein PilX
MPDVALPKAEHALSVLKQARLSRNEIAATMIAELVYQMAYTALRAREIDKSNASYRPLSHRTLVDAHMSRA